MPLFKPERYNDNLKELVKKIVLELTFNSYDLKEFAKDLRYKDEPFEWDNERRAILQAKLDAIYAHLYQITKGDLNYIIETFDIFYHSFSYLKFK